MSLRFETFQLDYNEDGCTFSLGDNLPAFTEGCCDYVEISYGNMSQKYCGEQIPGPFNDITESMTITFHTDESGNSTGFLAEVCCSVFVTEVNHQNITIGGTIMSSNYPSNYDNNYDEVK